MYFKTLDDLNNAEITEGSFVRGPYIHSMQLCKITYSSLNVRTPKIEFVDKSIIKTLKILDTIDCVFNEEIKITGDHDSVVTISLIVNFKTEDDLLRFKLVWSVDDL